MYTCTMVAVVISYRLVIYMIDLINSQGSFHRAITPAPVN